MAVVRFPDGTLRTAYVAACPSPVLDSVGWDVAWVYMLADQWHPAERDASLPILMRPAFVGTASMTNDPNWQYVRRMPTPPSSIPYRVCFYRGQPGRNQVDEHGILYPAPFWPLMQVMVCRAEGLLETAADFIRAYGPSGGSLDDVMRRGGGDYPRYPAIDPRVCPSPDFFPPAPEYSPPRHPTGTLIKFTINKSTSLLGRVIRDDANLWGLGDDYLLYIYKPECKPTPKCKVPGPEHLLLPPMIISDEGWRFGKFKTLRVEPVGPGESLPRHVFASSTSSTGYVDHAGAEVAKPAATSPLHIGTWEHTFVSMIAERAAAALCTAVEAPAPPPPLAVRPGVTLYIDMTSGVADTPLDRGEIAEELEDALGDLAELGDEGTNLATGEMEIEFDGTKVAAIEKKVRATLKRMGIMEGVRLVARGGRARRG